MAYRLGIWRTATTAAASRSAVATASTALAVGLYCAALPAVSGRHVNPSLACGSDLFWAGSHQPDLIEPRGPSAAGAAGCLPDPEPDPEVPALAAAAGLATASSSELSSSPEYQSPASASSAVMSHLVTRSCGMLTCFPSDLNFSQTINDCVACFAITLAKYRAPSTSTPKNAVGAAAQRQRSLVRGSSVPGTAEAFPFFFGAIPAGGANVAHWCGRLGVHMRKGGPPVCTTGTSDWHGVFGVGGRRPTSPWSVQQCAAVVEGLVVLISSPVAEFESRSMVRTL